MSKKSKKNNKNNIEELPSKSQCKMLSDTLDKNHMDHTQYFNFMAEDFDNLSSRSLDDVTEPILEQISSDYKHLIQSSAVSFWSTCSFNTYLQKSLDSFLKYAKKLRFSKYSFQEFPLIEPSRLYSKHQFMKKNHSYLEWMEEIYRIVFLIYSRMSNESLPDINPGKIIFENWLFDTVKALDLISIYGFEGLNKEALKTLIKSFYDLNKEYYEDFMNTLAFLSKGLETNLISIVDIKKRARLLGGESKVDASEVETRFICLLNLLDLSYIFNDILGYFPMKCSENLFLDERIILYCENLYYEIEGYRNFIKPEEIKPEVEPIISQILTNITLFFKAIFNFFIEAIANKLITESNAKKFQGKLEKILIDFGKMKFGSKKEPNNWNLFRHMIRQGFELKDFIDKMPSFITISNNDTIMILLATFESLKEEMKNQDLSEKSEEPEEEENEEKIKENVNVDEKLQSNENDGNKDEKNNEKNEKKQENEEKIKYTEVIIGKKDRNIAVLSEKDQKEMASFIKTQMEYEDEYDDTLEIYNEGRLFVEKNQLDPDSEEDYQINETMPDYEDEKNDDFVRNYKYSEKKYQTGYKESDDFYKEKNDFYKENKNYRNDKNDYQNNNNYNNKPNYGNKPNYRENYDNRDNRSNYKEKVTVVYEKKGEIQSEVKENEQNIVEEKPQSNQYSSQPGSSYNNKRKYHQEKSYKNQATYKRKY